MNENDKTQQNTNVSASATPASTRGPAMYYGPAPYHAASPLYPSTDQHYGQTPAYYGAGYGQPYDGAAAEDGGDSFFGAVTIERIVRVCMQRWMTILVVMALGAVISFAVYRMMAPQYKAVCCFEMSVLPKNVIRMPNAAYADDSFAQSDEIFNTRLIKLHGPDPIEKTIRRFHDDNPNSANPKFLKSDDELLYILKKKTKLELIRRSRLVTISVKTEDAELSVALANAYGQTAEAFSMDENRAQSENAVAFLKTTVDTKRQELVKADQEILDFRMANNIDSMSNEQKSVEAALLTLNADAVDIETKINSARELVKVLELLQNDPDKFGALPEAAPRSTTLIECFQKMKTAQRERSVLLATVTSKHPDVAKKEKEVENLKQDFSDEVGRTRETAKADLDLMVYKLDDITRRRAELNTKSAALEQKLSTARVRMEALQREREVAMLNFKAIMDQEQLAQLKAEDNNATIKISERAAKPTKDKPAKPDSPNPFIVLPAGPFIGLLLGTLFVLLLDHLEDKITGLPDIERRIRIKVLAVLPHIRRSRREQIALLTGEDRFSHFAEAFAGLRNLLDSPRYSSVSKVMLIVSTQPGEGKTITSSNFALSCALGGQRTLLVDCDLRRPRIARIYGKNKGPFESLSHTLAANDPKLFPGLPIASGYENLDLVCARPSSELSPSNLLASGAISAFFDWARQNYDRVIIDSPPFGLVSDSVVLGTLADGIILMCCPDRTRFRPLKHAVRHLTEAGGRVIGVLVNDVDFGRTGMFSRYDYHYHYSYRYKYGYGSPTRVAAASAAASSNKSDGDGDADDGDVDNKAGQKASAFPPRTSSDARQTVTDEDDE